MIRPALRPDNALASQTGDSSLARKLSLFAPLSDADRAVLAALTPTQEVFRPDTDIAVEGVMPRSVMLVQEGMAVRYRNLPDGRRQIMTFLIPGDLCDPHVFLLKAMDHSIGTITTVRASPVSRAALMETFATRPRISAALWWSSLQEESMLRERIVSLGRRDARGRIAYLLCELLWRHSAMGLAEDETYHLPLTQTELGDALGLTPVHVNRVLREFREQRLIAIEHRILRMLDVDGLQEIAAFNKEYLHLGGASPEVTRYFDRLEEQEGGE